jgi:hypothetical protein
LLKLAALRRYKWDIARCHDFVTNGALAALSLVSASIEEYSITNNCKGWPAYVWMRVVVGQYKHITKHHACLQVSMLLGYPCTLPSIREMVPRGAWRHVGCCPYLINQ